MTTERAVSISVIARKLGVTSETIRKWCRAGRIDYVRTPTGRYKLTATAVDALYKIKLPTMHENAN